MAITATAGKGGTGGGVTGLVKASGVSSGRNRPPPLNEAGMSFVADGAVKVSVAVAMHVAQSGLEPFWDTIISDANSAAYRQIVAHFLALGYSKAQIDLWDSGEDYQLFLARYQALIDGAGDKTEVGEWRAELDYWRGLLAMAGVIETDGEVVVVDTGGSSVGHGNLSTSTDIFRRSDGRGEVTRW